MITGALVCLAAAIAAPGSSIGLADTVVRELAALDGRVTPAGWLRTHPGDRLGRYQFDPFLQDGAPWCVEAVSRRRVPGGRLLTRRAVFYPPAPSDSAARSLPPLPPRVDSTLVGTGCRLGLLLIVVSPSSANTELRPFIDSLQRVLGWRHGSPDTGQALVRYWASARWKHAAGWRIGARALVTAYDPGGDGLQDASNSGPRVLAFAHLPASRLGLPLKEDLRDQEAIYFAATRMDSLTLEQALALAGTDSAAAAPLRALHHLGRLYAWKGIPDSVSLDTLVIPPLQGWRAATATLPMSRRAAALLAADRVLAAITGAVGSEDATRDSQTVRAITAATGARYVFLPIGGGYAYEGNLLREARAADSTGAAGELAFVTELEQGFIEPACGGDPAGEHFLRVIREGERFLARAADPAWRARAHLALADAYRDVVAIGEGVVFEGPDPARYRRQVPRARERAVAHYRAFLAQRGTAQGSATEQAGQAWREAWRLLAGLAPADTRFVCVYD